MTKPSDFILNSDYLALTQTSKSEFTAFFPSETFPGGYMYNRTQDFTVPYLAGAIDTFLLSLNGSKYMIGACLLVDANSPSIEFSVYRVNPNTIRVRLHEFNSDHNGYTMPDQTLKVKVNSFIPPDTF